MYTEDCKETASVQLIHKKYALCLSLPSLHLSELNDSQFNDLHVSRHPSFNSVECNFRLFLEISSSHTIIIE